MRTLRGEDPLVVRQGKDAWEDQYRKGKWERLRDAQENTKWIAAYIVQREKGGKRSSVLDVGCGEGALLECMRQSGSLVPYLGIDISETAIKKAQMLFPSEQFTPMDVELPQLKDQFDVIVFNEILYYVDAKKVLYAYRPFLARGGVVIISMYRSWRTRILWFLVKKVLRIECIHELPKHRIGVFSSPALQP